MNKIPIFQKEIEDGISEQVQTTASVAYLSPFTIKAEEFTSEVEKSEIEKLLADEKKQHDLFYLESVLVSTNWNRNDDVFLADATWAARNTPEDKPFNFMHDENDIIGHIIGSYVTDAEGNRIPDDQEEAPANFDIITRAVLYNSWMNQENRERMDNIIAEIDEDKWFVSMECLFAGFDYAVIDKTGNQQLVTRSDDSSFLTKHLRAYGGTGEYEGYKVGRALRDISFSGKGLVSNPANPRSIILNSKSIAFSVDGFSTMKETNMSESQVQEEQLVEEPVVAEELTEEVVETVEADAVTDDSSTEATEVAEVVEEVVETVTEDTVATDDKTDEAIASLEEALKSAEAKISALEAVVAKSAQDLKQAEAEMYDMKKKQKEEKRKAALIEAGVSADEVDATLASFGSLDDEAFDAVVNLYARKSVVATDSKEEVVEEAEAEATEIFDEVETSEATLVEAETEEVDEIQATRASISEYISQSILSK
tara:strand:- start:1389 stop:2837 length:1449 start_codon:yes stop_codon:yes gene_type:complete